jgi:2-dehydro-3-deoxygluconokinase
MHGGAAPSRARPAGTRFRGDTLNTALTRPPGEPGARFTSRLPARTGSAALAAWQQEGIHTDWVQRLADKAPVSISSTRRPTASARSPTGAATPPPATGWRKPRARPLAPGPVRSCLRERHQPGHTAARLAPAPAGRTRRSARPGARIAFDNNYRPRLWQARQGDRQRAYTAILRLADIALLTLDDEQASGATRRSAPARSTGLRGGRDRRQARL